MKKTGMWIALWVAAWVVAGWTAPALGENGSADSKGDGRPYYDFGVFAYEDGDYEEALDHFQMALAFDPDNPDYHYYIGKTFLRQDRFEPASVHLNRALVLNPDIPGLKYDAALLYFRQGDNVRASELFQKAASDSPDDVLASYYAGVTLFRLAQYRKAAKFFLEAAEKSPDARAKGRYYAAVAFHKSGRSDHALKLFQEVIDDPEAGAFAEMAREWATAIRDGGEANRPLALFLKLGRRYDDNVTLDPEGIDLFADEADWGTHLFFSGRYDFLRRDSFWMGAGYSHYWMDYDDLDEYDLTGSLGDFYAAYRISPFTFRLVVSPAFYWADGDSYLRRFGAGPDLLWRTTPRLLTRISYRFADNTYFDDGDRTGHDNTLFSEVHYRLPENRVRFFGRLEYENRSAESADEGYDHWRCRIGAAVELPWKLEAGIAGAYLARRYDTADRFYGLEREDDRYTVDLNLLRPILFDWLGMLAEYRHIRNDSNVEDYEYTRNQFTLSVTATY